MIRQAHEKEKLDGRVGQFKPYEMGLQVSCGVYYEVPQEGDLKSLRQHLGEVFHDLARQRECKIEEGHMMLDHVHILISIPPKYSVSQVIGYIEGKSAIHLARVYGERKQNYVGQHLWARGHLVSTVGRDERGIREYIRNQEVEDERLDQLNLWK